MAVFIWDGQTLLGKYPVSQSRLEILSSRSVLVGWVFRRSEPVTTVDIKNLLVYGFRKQKLEEGLAPKRHLFGPLE